MSFLNADILTKLMISTLMSYAIFRVCVAVYAAIFLAYKGSKHKHLNWINEAKEKVLSNIPKEFLENKYTEIRIHGTPTKFYCFSDDTVVKTPYNRLVPQFALKLLEKKYDNLTCEHCGAYDGGRRERPEFEVFVEELLSEMPEFESSSQSLYNFFLEEVKDETTVNFADWKFEESKKPKLETHEKTVKDIERRLRHITLKYDDDWDVHFDGISMYEHDEKYFEYLSSHVDDLLNSYSVFT